ncbi:bis(5'-nucleosyl)-tetraphosphatase (symmetrical) [Candidatus Endobugula sertula]|uniref:Bis(5'-nucleosyl)-tetraphosphatase, symmetrical n=1 Tax=Candidatus Endobugula sertula TaxID=62101 RepID=A0A1D2QQA3_9GAMM|nr:bis(5'-nucleosyl)-tetraphosphatase (symmetrical) [Candidatus Endobugula sertula]
MATYAVGDLQGCLTPLKQLLDMVEFDPREDTLWLTGDLINRGPESLETLRFLYQSKDHIISVLGNHDLHLLAIDAGYRTPSQSDTINPILTAPDKAELLYWIRHRPFIHHDCQLNYTMVHAGIPPQWSLEKAQEKARIVEQVLQSDRHSVFFENMYGDSPSGWEEGLSITEGWRVITNYFTRMRFCTEKGQLEFETKTGIEYTPKGYLPWFAHKKRKTRNNNIIFGHWAALEGKTNSDRLFALDTGYVWGKAMTMIRLEDREVFSIRAQAN